MSWWIDIDFHAMAEALTLAVMLLLFPFAIGGVYLVPMLVKNEAKKAIDRKIAPKSMHPDGLSADQDDTGGHPAEHSITEK